MKLAQDQPERRTDRLKTDNAPGEKLRWASGPHANASVGHKTANANTPTVERKDAWSTWLFFMGVVHTQDRRYPSSPLW